MTLKQNIEQVKKHVEEHPEYYLVAGAVVFVGGFKYGFKHNKAVMNAKALERVTKACEYIETGWSETGNPDWDEAYSEGAYFAIKIVRDALDGKAK